ncbi:MAG TPA: glycosyltransferase [Vicinamibacterales bacterium]|nr:glycosyltransferase [Vicinamibacterales bacterium]
MSRNPRVSFVIPVRNDAARLQTCLRSILRNPQAPNQVQVIVVDNASTDDSAAVARRLGAEVLTVESGRVAELRNRGARYATGDVLAFVDADNEIAAGWLYAALECLRMPQVGAVGAMYQAPPDGTWVQRTYGHLRGGPRDQHDADWLGSGNMAVSRTAFELVDGFDTSLDTCEDVDFCHRLRARSLRVVSDSRLKSVHHGDPSTLWEVLTSERWRGRDNLRVTFRKPVTWTSVPSAVVPVFHVLFMALGVIGLGMLGTNTRLGMSLVAAAIAGFAVGTAVRVVRAAVREAAVRASLLRAFAVASFLDAGRALALISRAPHRGGQSRPTATAV